VATVVLQLLETVRPDRAYFGEKDYQQLTIIRRLVRDLGLPVAVVGCKTVRETDGLALSSRNRYLSPRERALAPRLQAALSLGALLARSGKPPRQVERRVRRELKAIPGLSVDYISLADAETLEPAASARGRLRLLAAVRLGRTRLIDNVPAGMG
jgi:pantoate--beta-alanine ligase